ncbi:MAG: hypothetical protein U9P14_07370, partial [Gemmatimonadota bacterium]|nr:hypothetical protein [Gemmatimonadota bacterium]
FTSESYFPNNKITGGNLVTPYCMEIGKLAKKNLPFMFPKVPEVDNILPELDRLNIPGTTPD